MDPTENTIAEMDWDVALAENNGDYAYASDGGMINRQSDGFYTVANGNIQAAIAGDWESVERTGLTTEEIPEALQALNMSPDGWSYE